MVLCIALDRATVTVGVVIGSLAHLTMPAISSLISKNSEQYEQARALLAPLMRHLVRGQASSGKGSCPVCVT